MLSSFELKNTTTKSYYYHYRFHRKQTLDKLLDLIDKGHKDFQKGYIQHGVNQLKV